MIMRLVTMLPVLVYGLSSVPGNDGKELPVPISDVMQRLVDLEKRLLVQEQKNLDLEKRLVDQEKLNRVQMEMIRELSTCACKSYGKETAFSGDGRNNSRVGPFLRDFQSARTDEGFPTNTRVSESQTKGRLPLSSFKQLIGERSIGQSNLGHIDATSKSKRVSTGRVAFYAYMLHKEESVDITRCFVFENVVTDVGGNSNRNTRNIGKGGQVAFYAYMSHIQEGVGHHQTFIFDQVITNVGGNYNRFSGMFTSPSHGFYVFSWTLYCQRNGYFVSEVVANSQAVGSLYCDAQGADGTRHITGVVVVEINQGDVVFVRTHPLYPNSGNVYSSDFIRSSFTGWKMF